MSTTRKRNLFTQSATNHRLIVMSKKIKTQSKDRKIMARILNNRVVVGNVGNVYDKRTVGPENRSVIDFSIAQTPRVRDESNEWSDGPTTWINVTAWGALADNIATSLRSGDHVLVTGREETSTYKKKDGTVSDPRTVLIADAVGLELGKYGAKSDRVPGSKSGNGSNSSGNTGKKAAAKPASNDVLDDFGSDDDEELGF